MHRPTSRRTAGNRFRGERGVAVILTALVLVPLMVFAAFGVDLASFYARVGELQRAADAAALAGTVWMPDYDKAKAEAAASLRKNGFVDGEDGIVVTYSPGKRINSFVVTVEDTSVRTYFSRVIGHRQAIARSAEAQYNLPLPLGSPLNFFGGDMTKTGPPIEYLHRVSWPADYTTRTPTNAAGGCNVGTDATPFGRWSGGGYDPGAHVNGGARCYWMPEIVQVIPTSSAQVPSYGSVLPPDNAPCNRNQFQSGNGGNGRWDNGYTYSSSAKYTSGTGNRQCTWTVFEASHLHSGVQSTVNRSLITNRACNLPPYGRWNSGSSGSFQAGQYFTSTSTSNNRRLCELSTGLLVAQLAQDVPYQPPNPLDVDRPSGADLVPSGRRSPGFWAQIHGPGADQASGDAYSTRCTTSTNCSTPNNPLYDPAHADFGYWYVVKVPDDAPGGPVTIRVFDAQLTSGSLDQLTGDSTVSGSNMNFDTHYRVYKQTHPLDFTARTGLGPVSGNTTPGSCHWTVRNQPQFRGAWVDLCTVDTSPGDIYLVNVKTTTISGVSNSAGRNGYALEACLATSCVTPGQPELYAYNKMVMYNNIEDGTATFYIAEVGPQYAGKSLVLELFDPGEASGQAWMYPMMPSKSAPKPVVQVPSSRCSFESTRSSYPRASDVNQAGRCGIRTSDGGALFNGHWVTIRIDIPADYTCQLGADPEVEPDSCWWGIEYRFTGAATDTTTWKARVEGNPVHLTE